MNRLLSSFYRTVFVVFMGIAASCAAAAATGETAGNTGYPAEVTAALERILALDAPDTAKDLNAASLSGAATITVANGASTTAATAGVNINNSTNTITITKAGTYALRGTLSSGQVVVDVDGDVYLILNGVNITSRTGSPLALFGKDKKVITLAAGTTNTLTDAATYTTFYRDDEPNGALFAKNALTINGAGSLVVNGNYNNGISCKDNLKIMSGTITVNAVNNALKGNDSIVIRGGTLTLVSKGDGIKADSEDAGAGFIRIEAATATAAVTITSGEDGIQAYRSLFIATGAKLSITAGGGSVNSTRAYTDTTSRKAVKSDLDLLIAGGTLTLNSPDDGIHANDTVIISGGTIAIQTNDDGIHGEKFAVISGGGITITRSYEGIEAAQVLISGGDIHLVSADDGINAANGSGGGGWGAAPMGGGRGGRAGFGTVGGGAAVGSALTISGGTITVNAGGDGLDSNGALLITGGTVVVHGPTNSGNGALDSDGAIVVNGGVILAAGAAGMAEVPGQNSTQLSLAITFRSGKAAGTTVTIKDSAGKTVAEYSAAKSFQMLVVSSPALSSGATYSIYVNNVSAGTARLSGVVTRVSL